jgi:hypothetical protein
MNKLDWLESQVILLTRRVFALERLAGIDPALVQRAMDEFDLKQFDEVEAGSGPANKHQ